MNILYDYLFHYNPYKRLWYAFKRDEASKYFNGELKNTMKHPELDELIINIIEKDSR